MDSFNMAREFLHEFKGDSYLFGAGVLKDAGRMVGTAGKRAALVCSIFQGSDDYVKVIRDSLCEAGVSVEAEIKGAKVNCPREDVFRITKELKETSPDVIVSFGGGSTIDAAKTAGILYTLSEDIETFFGAGLVTKSLSANGKMLLPHVAIQTAASSAAHLTKYSNITDVSTFQKKLIIDDAIIPKHAVFDYAVTYNAPVNLIADGGLDGISHALEVLYGAVGKPYYEKISRIAGTCIDLIVRHLPQAIENPQDKKAYEALCLATDLGGYCIMIGGTNGGHLTSFSLVDILSHGRACAIMNPYYTVFFAPAIEEPLRFVGNIYRRAGLTNANMENLKGRQLGVAVAQAMFELARRIGLPTRLGEVPGFSQVHIDNALRAAKNPQLKTKLQNMPVPLTDEMIDEYMKPVLEAARDGNLAVIRNGTAGP